jgi:methionyl-tRNA formyltransferase
LSEAIRIAFAGTPEFAVPVLQAVAASHAEIPLVLTQPDRPAGRGRKLTASAVKAAALQLGLNVQQPPRVKDPALAAGFGAAPDLMVVVAYGLLLPPWLLEWPRLGCVNVHASLLPRWRGAAPIQRALWAGDTCTGVSLMQMTRGLDCGPVYARRAIDIGPADTAGDLHDRLAVQGAELLSVNLAAILARTLAPEVQDESLVTYAAKLSKADAALDWHAPALELERQVRALNPWPVAEAKLSDGRRIRIWEAQALDTESKAPCGSIVASGPAGIDVATGRGCLRLSTIQAPGSKAMPAAAYLAAHALQGVSFGSA